MSATVTARCQCGLELDHPAEYATGTCLPCQLGSVPLSASQIREASFGYGPMAELQQDAAEDAECCALCDGAGWVETDCLKYVIECQCVTS